MQRTKDGHWFHYGHWFFFDLKSNPDDGFRFAIRFLPWPQRWAKVSGGQIFWPMVGIVKRP